MFKKYVFLNISGGYLKGGRLLSSVVASYMAEPTSYWFSMIGIYESSLFRFRLNYQVEQSWKTLSSTFTFFHPGGLPWSVVLNAQTFLWIGMDGLLYVSLLEAALCCANNEVDGYINVEFSPVWCKAALGRMCNCHLK